MPAPTTAANEAWRPLAVTQARTAELWAALQAFPDVCRMLRIDGPDAWIAKLADPTAFFIDIGPGAALLAAVDIEPGHGATVVFCGWDHHVQTHAPAFEAGLTYVMQLAQLRRVTTYIPTSLPVLVKLATKHLGFAWEGVLRDGWAPGVDLMVNGRLAG